MTSPAAPANTPSAAATAANKAPAAATPGQPAQALLQDVCVVEGKDANNAILIERPVSETKVVEIQPGQEYLFGFSKSAPVSYVQQGDDLTIAFDCGGVLILKGYGKAVHGSQVAEFAFSDVVPQGVLAGLIKVVQTEDEKILEEEMLANAKHHKGEHHNDGQNVANIEPAAGDQDAQKLANIEPAAGDAGGVGAGRGGVALGVEFLSLKVFIEREAVELSISSPLFGVPADVVAEDLHAR